MDGFVVGVSGGIDSAVTSTICARTGYPTLCLEMPIHQNKSVSKARKHIQWLEEIMKMFPITIYLLVNYLMNFVFLYPTESTTTRKTCFSKL